METIGISELSIFEVDAKGECLFCTGPLIGESFIIKVNDAKSNNKEFGFHDTCFMHMVLVIKKYEEEVGFPIARIAAGKERPYD